MVTYIEAIIALFAIVDPIGNIPMFIAVTEHLPADQSKKAFNTAIAVSVCILVAFAFAGRQILGGIFHIQIYDLQIAGGILLLIIAIDHLIFGSLRRTISVKDSFTPHEIGCVPLACPLLAGPGAMVTCLTTLETSGPLSVIVAITVVFAALWLIMRFIEPVHKILGRLFCMVFSKVMCLFIAAIGVKMIITGIKHHFT